MALKAGYRGIKKYIADKLNRMNPGDSFATDAEIEAAVAPLIPWDKVEDYVSYNIIPVPYKTASGTTIRGVTLSYGKNGIITFSGDNDDTNDSEFDLVALADNFCLPVGKYILSGGNSLTTKIFVLYDGNYYNSRPDAVEINITDAAKPLRITAVVTKGSSPTGLLYPMLRKEGTPSIFVSYLTPNTEISNKADITALATKADITALGTQEGAIASGLYHPGEHFYKDGKFCTVIGIADVAAESTWTLNTNYVEGTIAELLITQKATFEYTQNVSDVTNSNVVKFGKVVSGQIQFKIASTTLDTPVLCFTLPSGFRPASLVYGTTTDIGSNLTDEKHQFEINTSGAVNVILRNEHDAFRWVAFNFVFITV